MAESTLIISAGILCVKYIAKSVLPHAVGPMITIILFIVSVDINAKNSDVLRLLVLSCNCCLRNANSQSCRLYPPQMTFHTRMFHREDAEPAAVYSIQRCYYFADSNAKH